MHESHACATRQQHVRQPGPAWPLRYAHSFPGRADQIRQVRAYLREILAGWPRADDAVAVASELAANSVLHSRSGLPGGVFTVRAEIHRGTCTCIAVQDEGGAWGFRPGEIRPEHGLDVVQALAGPGNWGVGGDAAGRIVWARLLWPGAALPPASAIDPAIMPDVPDTASPPPGQRPAGRIGTPAIDPAAASPQPGQSHGDRIGTRSTSHRPGGDGGSDDGAGDDDVLADLDTLATELAAHGVEAHLIVPGGNHSPHLVVRSAAAGLTERVYAQADWFFWPTSERIAARDDVQTAVVTLIRVFNGQSRAPYA